MRAARFRRPGGPEVLTVDEVPEPRPPTGDELLVLVEASSVNGTDLGLRRGDLRVALNGRLPYTVGFDLAGTVLACGPTVTAFAPGDRVMALLGHTGGGLAEQVLLRQSRAARVPSAVSSVDAAALPLAGLTALQALYGKAALHTRPAARVLVHGASGGIGSYGVQLAKLAGAHVTATASTGKLDAVARLGADVVVDRHAQDVTALGERWDIVLDAPGVLTFARVRPVLTEGGVLVSTRPVSADALRSLLLTRGRGFAAVMTQARSQDLAYLGALVERCLLRPLVDTVLPLEQAAQAHRRAEGPAVGKVVVQVSGG